MYKLSGDWIEYSTGDENQKGFININNSNHRFYQQFIKDIVEKGMSVVEGPDIVEPSYTELRKQEYPSREEQLDMMYWDKVNGTTVWEDTIQTVKDKYPKTITGGITIGEIPAWVQEAVDEYNASIEPVEE